MPKTLKNFKPIREIDNYLIDSTGRIFSCKRHRLLVPNKSKFGYLRIGLCDKNKKHIFFVHKLVASIFIDNPDNKSQVNHINGIKTDNRVCNLEWVTPKENTLHAHRTGLCSAKLTDEDVLMVWERRNESIKETAKLFNVDSSTICNIYSGKSKQHLFEENYHKFPKTRGRKTHRPKLLTQDDIISIQQLSDSFSKSRIAEQFGVSRYIVARIINKTGKYSDI
jgi:HNH endonuclease/NUMOD4 motif